MATTRVPRGRCRRSVVRPSRPDSLRRDGPQAQACEARLRPDVARLGICGALGDNRRYAHPEPAMPESAHQPSYVLETVIATCVGTALGLLTENLALGTGVGIAIGCLLSVIKLLRLRKRGQ